MTETWLRDNENDKLWTESSEFNKPPWTIHTCNRNHSRGGGIALICRNDFIVKHINIGDHDQRVYEQGTWTINTGKKTLTLTIIYHPPPKNGITNSMFIDQFTDNITSILANNQNNIILGDFNLHNPNDTDPFIFMDMIQALGLSQIVTGSTHKQGNTLDLILIEAFGDLSTSNCILGNFISDHRIVHTSLNIPKNQTKREKIKVRSVKKISPADLISAFNHDNIRANDLLTSLDEELVRILDQLAPIKEITATLHKKTAMV